MCVPPREPPVDVRPVAAARSAAAADLAAAPPPEHHQPQQRLRGQAAGVDFLFEEKAVKAYHLHKKSGTDSKEI